MSDVHEEEQGTGFALPDSNGGIPERQSIADRLRQKAKDSAMDKTHDIDIPGYGGELFCRYRLLTTDELDEIVRYNRENSPRQDQLKNSVLDNLIKACDEFYIREGKIETPLSQHEAYEGPHDIPVRYDSNLAEFLDITKDLGMTPSARGVVQAVFGFNDIAINAHGAQLSQWMMKGEAGVAALLGGP